MAIAPPSTTAKELRFERSAPPSLVLKRIIYLHRLFFAYSVREWSNPCPPGSPRARRCALLRRATRRQAKDNTRSVEGGGVYIIREQIPELATSVGVAISRVRDNGTRSTNRRGGS